MLIASTGVVNIEEFLLQIGMTIESPMLWDLEKNLGKLFYEGGFWAILRKLC